MAVAQSQTINLGLPAIPETTDSKLFMELVRVYNAIQLLAQGLDNYTGDGTIGVSVSTLNAAILDIRSVLDTIVDNSAEFTEFRKHGKFDTLVAGTVTSVAGFGCNSKTPQVAVTLPANATDLPTALTLINAIKVALVANGIGA